VATDEPRSFCCEDTRNEFCIIASHVWILRQNDLARTVNMPTSAEISRTVNRLFARNNSRTSATESPFLLIDCRPDRGWSSTEVRPSLNPLNYSNVRARLKRSLPKAVFNISKVFAPFFPKFKAERDSYTLFLPLQHSESDPKCDEGLVHVIFRPKMLMVSGRPLCRRERRLKATIQQRCVSQLFPPSGVTEPVSELIDHTLYTV
jgi:hypothetical protein